MEDQREISKEVAGELDRLADRYPVGSRGRYTLFRAAKAIRLDYIATRPHKLKHVLKVVESGCRRISEIAEVSGIDRREVVDLVETLAADGYLLEGKSPRGSRGRPARVFTLSDFCTREIK